MKIWMLSDLHFGKYTKDQDKWLKNMTDYFYDFFIPLLKEYKKENDKLFILGDLFDNRSSISIKAINTVINLFEDLSKIIEIHILLGNHDMYLMNTPDINSVSVIRNISNIIVYDKPTEITIDNHEILMMPWINGKNNEIEILEKYKGKDLLFCHSDLNGCRTQLYPTRPLSRHILDITDFVGYTKVYSGHIHIVQTINNFTFVGSPYHLDRNDVGNRKGIFIYDTVKKKDVFIENDFSPEFKKIKLITESDFTDLEDVLNTNNFIDLYISTNLLVNNPQLRLQLDKITNKYKIEHLEFINDVKRETKKTNNINIKNKSIETISKEWVDNIEINVDTDMFVEIDIRKKINEILDNCYKLEKLKNG
jgi:DNA repair exonuclease SbcCD nuclease subunit